ncbi:MAG: response regulator [Gemmatimonadaceae bacterium]
MGVVLSSAGNPAEALNDRMAAIRERSLPAFLLRADAIASAASAVADGVLDDEVRRSAEREAHKLAGAGGSFGFQNVTELAREAEHLFEGDGPISSEVVLRLTEIAAQIRTALEEGPQGEDAPGSSPQAVARAVEKYVLLFSADAELAARLGAELSPLGVSISLHDSVDAAKELRQDNAVIGAIVDLGSDSTRLAVVRSVNVAFPQVATVVCGESDDWAVRLEAAGVGAAGYLSHPVSCGDVVDLLGGPAMQEPCGIPTLIALGLSAAKCEALQATVTESVVRVVAVDDAEALWGARASGAPAVILVVGDGARVEAMCRVVRGDFKFATSRLLVLSSVIQPGAITSLLGAGADDVLPESISDADLAARVTVWLRRDRGARQEIDALTGVATQRRSISILERGAWIAAKSETALSIVLVEIDLHDDIVTKSGRLMADAVLAHCGRDLELEFHDAAVIGRWQDRGFVVVLSNTDASAATRRVTGFLQRSAANRLGVSTASARAMFSAGVASFPDDGRDWRTLTDAAVVALRDARRNGGGRVRSLQQRRDEAAMSRVDVAIVDDDSVLTGAIEDALSACGHSTRVIDNGLSATAALAGIAAPLSARVILLDLGLPGQDGFAVLSALKQSGVLARSCVVVLTGQAQQNSVVQALQLGACDYVVKPVDIQDLVERVRPLVEQLPAVVAE